MQNIPGVYARLVSPLRSPPSKRVVLLRAAHSQRMLQMPLRCLLAHTVDRVEGDAGGWNFICVGRVLAHVHITDATPYGSSKRLRPLLFRCVKLKRLMTLTRLLLCSRALHFVQRSSRWSLLGALDGFEFVGSFAVAVHPQERYKVEASLVHVSQPPIEAVVKLDRASATFETGNLESCINSCKAYTK